MSGLLSAYAFIFGLVTRSQVECPVPFTYIILANLSTNHPATCCMVMVQGKPGEDCFSRLMGVLSFCLLLQIRETGLREVAGSAGARPSPRAVSSASRFSTHGSHSRPCPG